MKEAASSARARGCGTNTNVTTIRQHSPQSLISDLSAFNDSLSFEVSLFKSIQDVYLLLSTN